MIISRDPSPSVPESRYMSMVCLMNAEIHDPESVDKVSDQIIVQKGPAKPSIWLIISLL